MTDASEVRRLLWQRYGQTRWRRAGSLYEELRAFDAAALAVRARSLGLGSLPTARDALVAAIIDAQLILEDE